MPGPHGGVAGDQDGTPDGFATDLGVVAPEEAVVAEGPAKLNSWWSYSERMVTRMVRTASAPIEPDG